MNVNKNEIGYHVIGVGWIIKIVYNYVMQKWNEILANSWKKQKQQLISVHTRIGCNNRKTIQFSLDEYLWE